MKGLEFKDGPTFMGPSEAFMQPGSKVQFVRGRGFCEGTATISHVDEKTNSIYFSTPIPSGIKPGDKILLIK